MKIKKNILPAVCLFLLAVFPISIVAAENPKETKEANVPTVRKAAIFVENRTGAALNDKIATFEDFLTSRVSEKGFSIVSREVAISALKTYTSAEVAVSSQNVVGVGVNTPTGQKTAVGAVVEASAAQVVATPSTTKADQLLSDNTSALRLAQNLGVDFLLIASIASYGTEKKSFDDANLKTVNLIHNLRVSYKVLEAAQGGSLIGDTFKVSKTERFTENNNGSANSDVINDLLDQASTRIADSIGKKVEQDKVLASTRKEALVEFSVLCGMQDLGRRKSFSVNSLSIKLRVGFGFPC